MLSLGTSSWVFDGWKGVFYPDKLPKTEQLAYYARCFNTVEVNTSFYALPKPSTLLNWIESTPPGFTFCLKFPRTISHEQRLVNCEEESLAFLDVLRSLGAAAAPGFLQLPPDFTRAHYGKTLATYLDWLAPRATDLRIGVEVRATDLMTPAFAGFLAERGFAFVVVERTGAPDHFSLWDELVQGRRAPNFVIVRWIGDDKNGPKGNAELVAPRDAQLDQWAQRLARWHNAGLDLYGYMHNPYEGHSPASVRRLQGRLASLVSLPPWPSANPDEVSGQMSLF